MKTGAELPRRLGRTVTEWFERAGLEVVQDSVVPQAEIVVVLGGDGTLLHVAGAAYEYDIPILGVNLGGLGFLTEINAEEVESALKRIMAGEYAVEERMMFSVDILAPEGEVLVSQFALNEVAVLRGSMGKILNLPTWADGTLLTTYRGDGLIVSTPTGSTAYNLSAGGPIVYPSLEAMILTPVCPFALAARPLILAGDVILEVHLQPVESGGSRIAAGELPDCLIEIDGKVHSGAGPGTRLRIQQAPGCLKLIPSPFTDYFSILRETLGWAGHLAT